MNTDAGHADRIAAILVRLDETTERLVSRVERAESHAEQVADGWSATQILAHVALVNESLASVIDGTVAGAVAPADTFTERAWAEIAAQIPDRVPSPTRFLPPETVSITSCVDTLHASVAHLRIAISALSAERARHCFTTRATGTINLYQGGEFAIAHMIRHNQQAKRVLGD